MRTPGTRLSQSLSRFRLHQRGATVQHPPRPRRPFTSTAPLLLVARVLPRPQLPFLSVANRSRPHGKRFLSNEVRESIKYQVKLGIYWSLIGWVVLGGFVAAGWILRYDWLDRQYPAPPDWHWFIKMFWQDSKHEIETEGHGRGMIDWASAGTGFRAVVLWLEDFPFFWGRTPTGLIEQDECDSDVPGIEPEEMRAPPEPADYGGFSTRIGYDISMKSEQWRRGYFEANMNLAKAAEMRTGYLADRRTGKTFAPEHVRSPSNPYPKPVPQVMKHVHLPDIEDCGPSLESADFIYKRVLTTKGFSRKQRMEAGIAYATWLEHCGKNEPAERLYHWALDLALKGVLDPEKTVNARTGTILAGAPFVTPNILHSCTALAGFHARTGNTQAALPAFLSVLRARHDSPAAPAREQYPDKGRDYTLSNVDNVLRWIAELPTPPKYPDPPPEGDQQFLRARSTQCEEAALMAYVGEVLFAKSNQKRKGLALTRQATQIAEVMVDEDKLDKKGIKTCEQCFRTGLENWHLMARNLADEQAKTASDKSWKFWQMLDGGVFGGEDSRLLHSENWEEEKQKVALRLLELDERQLNERLNEYIKKNSSWFVV